MHHVVGFVQNLEQESADVTARVDQQPEATYELVSSALLNAFRSPLRH